uniref:Uncharacterized protein n=1 Tax=Tetranychus urticae TaxID=32264 RepID=T1JWS2_TETUR
MPLCGQVNELYWIPCQFQLYHDKAWQNGVTYLNLQRGKGSK